MSNLGVFRDSFYNAIHALPAVALTVGPVATGVLAASLIANAIENFVTVGGTSQTYTTDTAINIIAYLQNAVAAAQKANVGGFAAALGDTPPLGVPNLFNLSFFIDINANGATTGATLAGGTGVTLAGQGTFSPTTLSLTTPSRYAVQITSAITLTMTRVS